MQTAKGFNAILISSGIFTSGILLGYIIRSKNGQNSNPSNSSITTSTSSLTADSDSVENAAEELIIYQCTYHVEPKISAHFRAWILDRMEMMVTIPGVQDANMYTTLPQTNDSVETENFSVIFVLGGPGAGKGTQCAKIVTEFGYVHISAGDCLRAERNSGSPDAKLINQYISDGKIVPVEITVKLLNKAMKNSGGTKFLIDGFPRNENNLQGWYNVMGDQVHVAGVLFFDCPEEILEKRLLERGKTSGRADDNIDTIKKRFHTFQTETRPIIDYYQMQNKVYHIVADASINEVWEKVEKVLIQLESSNELLKPPSFRKIFTLHYKITDVRALSNYLQDFHPIFQDEMHNIFGRNLSMTSCTLDRISTQ